MEGLAPSPAEATVVTVLTVLGVLATLGLLTGLVIRRKAGGHTEPRAVRTGAGGLWTLTAIGAGALALGGRLDFARNIGVDLDTLLELHDLRTPVYWIAYLLGSGLLILLVTTLLRRRATLRWVLGPPALLAAALFAALLATLLWKIERANARVVAARLPGVAPDDELGDASLGVEPQAGFWLGLVGVTLLGLVVILLLADRYDRIIVIAAVACVTLVAGVVPPDTSFWARHADGRIVAVWYSAFGVGGAALLLPLAFTVLAVLLCLIPILPRWVRGIVAFLVALGPVWIGLATVAAYPALESGLPGLLRADGYVAEVRRLGVTSYVLTLGALAALPIAAVRAWRAGRRGGLLGDRTPPPERVGYLSDAPAGADGQLLLTTPDGWSRVDPALPRHRVTEHYRLDRVEVVPLAAFSPAVHVGGPLAGRIGYVVNRLGYPSQGYALARLGTPDQPGEMRVVDGAGAA